MAGRKMANGKLFPRGFSTATRFPWPLVRAEELVLLNYGKALCEGDRRPGNVRVYGTNGQCGWHDTPMRGGPGVILGRKGQGPLGVEWCNGDYWVIDTAYFVTPRTDSLHLKYFYYLVKYIGLNHLKDGTSNPSLSRDTFNALLLPFPPISAQKAIAHILGTLDNKIELNQRMNETLEAMARTIFKSWFVDFDPVRAKAEGRDSGLPKPIANLFPDRLAESELGKIPKGWEVQPVREVTDALFDGPHATPPESPDGPVFLGIKNLTGTQIDLTDVRHIGENHWPRWTKRVMPEPGDIVFTYEATLGFFALIPPSLRCCLGRRLALVRPTKSKPFRYFLFHSFVSTPFQRMLIERSTHGSTVDRVPLLDFPNYVLVWPPVSLRNTFEHLAEAIWAAIHRNQAESRTLAAVRDTLLPKFMSGEINLAK